MGKLTPHIFQCKCCGQIHKGMFVPSSLNCNAGFYHIWTDLGQEGNITYECEKCSTAIKLFKLPTSLNCPKGNGHSWKKLVLTIF